MNTETIYVCQLETPLGPATAEAGADALTGFWFNQQKYFPKKNANWQEAPDHHVFAALRKWLDLYFAGKKPPLNLGGLALSPKGTDFQKAVWQILLEIPLGGFTTYGTIASQLAEKQGLKSMSAQAVGGAVGHNPISVLIPCHRVLGSDGSLTGYAGGLDKKKALLRLEGVAFREEGQKDRQHSLL